MVRETRGQHTAPREPPFRSFAPKSICSKSFIAATSELKGRLPWVWLLLLFELPQREEGKALSLAGAKDAWRIPGPYSSNDDSGAGAGA